MRGVTLLLAAALAAVSHAPVRAQDIAARVTAVRDGFVRMSYAAREGVCGSGDHIRWGGSQDDPHWESACDGEPVRVVIERRAGTIEDIETHVGGRWREHAGVVDLGDVPAGQAADFFLSLVPELAERTAKDALTAAALADSVDVWPRMMNLARDESIPVSVRKSAVFWTGNLGDDQVVDVLLAYIDAEPNEELRLHAVFALSQQRNEPAARALRAIAEDGERDTALRDRAIFWLGQGRDDRSHAYLRTLYASVTDRELKDRIIFAVSQRATDEDWGWILGVAQSNDEPMELRKKALFWAGQSRHDAAALADLYDEFDSRELKESLLFALSQKRGDEGALNKLMEIVTNESDARLRGRALFWLGQSKDPRVIRFLAELIG